MDGKAVASSIEAKYENLKKCYEESGDSVGCSLGQRFLEKIIQIKFFIPRSGEKLIESFVDSNLGKADRLRRVMESSNEDKKQEYNEQKENEIQRFTEQVISGIQKGKSLEAASSEAERSMPISDIYIKEEAKKRAFANTFENSYSVGKAIYGALKYLDSNPRKIKRFINLFRLQSYIADRRNLLKEDLVQLDLLAKWTVISLQWPELFQKISFDEDFFNSFEKHGLEDYFKSKNIKDPSSLIDILEQYKRDELPLYIFLSKTTVE